MRTGDGPRVAAPAHAPPKHTPPQQLPAAPQQGPHHGFLLAGGDCQRLPAKQRLSGAAQPVAEHLKAGGTASASAAHSQLVFSASVKGLEDAPGQAVTSGAAETMFWANAAAVAPTAAPKAARRLDAPEPAARNIDSMHSARDMVAATAAKREATAGDPTPVKSALLVHITASTSTADLTGSASASTCSEVGFGRATVSPGPAVELGQLPSGCDSAAASVAATAVPKPPLTIYRLDADAITAAGPSKVAAKFTALQAVAAVPEVPAMPSDEAVAAAGTAVARLLPSDQQPPAAVAATAVPPMVPHLAKARSSKPTAAHEVVPSTERAAVPTAVARPLKAQAGSATAVPGLILNVHRAAAAADLAARNWRYFAPPGTMSGSASKAQEQGHSYLHRLFPSSSGHQRSKNTAQDRVQTPREGQGTTAAAAQAATAQQLCKLRRANFKQEVNRAQCSKMPTRLNCLHNALSCM